jgi:hypothetical protein
MRLHEGALKRNLPIVSVITAVDLPNGTSVILIIHEAIYNDTANHSLFSEFQLRYFGVKLIEFVTNMEELRKWRFKILTVQL